MRILVTGGAGFIGSHLVERLLADGEEVTVLDDFNPSYAPAVKERNLTGVVDQIRLLRGDVRDPESVAKAFDPSPDAVVHLAARAGVRASLEDPVGYHDVNVVGTIRVLEAVRERGTGRFVFGSSSSVYGDALEPPFREDAAPLLPVSPYAASKLSAEAHVRVAQGLHGFAATCLRFFTVFGPRQRPDMAIHRFADRIVTEEPIPVYGDGSSVRDYTYVDDLVAGIVAAVRREGQGYETFNLGGGSMIPLRDVISTLSHFLRESAVLDRLPEQPGDVPRTGADVTRAREILGWEPKIPFREGIRRFVEWFRVERGIEAPPVGCGPFAG